MGHLSVPLRVRQLRHGMGSNAKGACQDQNSLYGDDVGALWDPYSRVTRFYERRFGHSPCKLRSKFIAHGLVSIATSSQERHVGV